VHRVGETGDGVRTLQTEPSAVRDLEAYIALPRVGGLMLSPDTATELINLRSPSIDPRKNPAYSQAIWESTQGARPGGD